MKSTTFIAISAMLYFATLSKSAPTISQDLLAKRGDLGLEQVPVVSSLLDITPEQQDQGEAPEVEQQPQEQIQPEVNQDEKKQKAKAKTKSKQVQNQQQKTLKNAATKGSAKKNIKTVKPEAKAKVVNPQRRQTGLLPPLIDQDVLGELGQSQQAPAPVAVPVQQQAQMAVPQEQTKTKKVKAQGKAVNRRDFNLEKASPIHAKKAARAKTPDLANPVGMEPSPLQGVLEVIPGQGLLRRQLPLVGSLPLLGGGGPEAAPAAPEPAQPQPQEQEKTIVDEKSAPQSMEPSFDAPKSQKHHSKAHKHSKSVKSNKKSKMVKSAHRRQLEPITDLASNDEEEEDQGADTTEPTETKIVSPIKKLVSLLADK
ncbi:uncharacterized protein VTP21DRAFT_4944 [Calcarisporiella thermophila]|uniref:uncharacterized protein n=1 Tax=Calcarisporiella thermophila TaxID=911321 RepID=UPI0037447703